MSAASDLPRAPIVLQLPDEWELTDDLLLELCALNDEWLFEADADGALLIVPSSPPRTSERTLQIGAQLLSWADTAGGAVGGSALFRLPDGSRRIAKLWRVNSEQRAAVPAEQSEGIWPLAPELVIEIRPPHGDLAVLKAKMESWIANGVRLGWLVDPFAAQLHIYRPNAEPERLQRPAEIEDAELLPGLTVDLSRIWR